MWQRCIATAANLRENLALGRLVDAMEPEVSVLSINGGSTILLEAFCEYLGSGYCQKLVDYPDFDLRLFKRCLERTTSSVFGSLDGPAMTEFIVNRLKGAETRDWMSSGPALRIAIITNDSGMLHLVDVVANIIGVRPLIASYLKETGRKYDGVSLVVRSSSFDRVGAFSYPHLLYLAMFSSRGRTDTSTWIR